MFKWLKRVGEDGLSKTKTSAAALILVQLAEVFGYELPQDQVQAAIKGILAVISLIGLYQKVERTTSADA